MENTGRDKLRERKMSSQSYPPSKTVRYVEDISRKDMYLLEGWAFAGILKNTSLSEVQERDSGHQRLGR